MSAVLSIISAIVVLAVIGALVLVLLCTDFGDSCCSGAIALMFLIGIGTLALFMLGGVALFGSACVAVF